jgi:outer membrane protein assembly factor BamB
VDRLIGAFGQLESAWPVHGGVLVQNGTAYFAAGRSSQLDGGIYLYGVDAATGELAWSIWLGSNASAGPFPDAYAEAGFCEWDPKVGFSVLASPAVSQDGVVVVGTLEGVLYAVGDRTW